MRFDVDLTGEAAALAREHAGLLARLPATLGASIFIELRKWPLLFAPEQAYQRTLLRHLAARPAAELTALCAGIARVEGEAGARAIAARDPARFQEEAQALLRKRRLLTAWRAEVDEFFRGIDPAVHAELLPRDAPRRLVVQLYGSGIAVQDDRLWSRFGGVGMRMPLDLGGARGAEAFLRGLFGDGADGAPGPSLFASAARAAGLGPLDAWIVESQDVLHGLCEAAAGRRESAPGLTGLSYDRLRPYRDELTRALYAKVQSGVESPQAFAAYARSLTLLPGAGVLLHDAEILHAFIRDVLLTGNGTLFVNNTFVEWAAVQALRRAQPRLLVARYGIRDKMKPFSSLLLFSQPRASDQIPLLEDPIGSFIDVEQLVYYVWLNAEKSPAYRGRTLYLFLAEGFAELLAIRSDVSGALPAPSAPATLADVCATMAQWLGVPNPAPSGRSIGPLVA